MTTAACWKSVSPLVLLVCVLCIPHLISGQCTTSSSTTCTTTGSARLRCLEVPGTNSRVDSNAGRLEVCVGDQYGTVQLDSSSAFWSEKNTLVACRQLGFQGALNSIPPIQLSLSNYASSSVGIHYRSVVCDGTESSIANCTTRTTGITISHTTDVFLVCWPSNGIYTDLHSNLSSSSSTGATGSIRLVGETANGRGVVEILTGIGWSTICPGSTWTSDDATDICQYLGYDSGTARTLELDSSLVSPRLVRDPECSSTTQLATITRIDGGFCTFDQNSCGETAGRYAAVTCSSRGTTGSTRLFGLDTISSSRRQGVVEYFANGRWGVVCQPSSTTQVDESICDGFGYNRDDSTLISLSVSRIQMVESRMKPLWIANMQCLVSDRRFSDCSIIRPLGYGTCGSTRNILVVDCGRRSSGLSSGVIAAIVIPILVVVGIVIFLIIKKDEWVPAMKRHPMCQSVKECLSCQCLSISHSSSSQSRNVTGTRQFVAVTPSQAPAPIPPPAPTAIIPQSPAAAAEPTHDEAELSKPPPPSYNTSFNLPNLKEELPPPYSAHLAAASAPPPAAYAVPQGNVGYPPVDPAYPPGANAPYPPGANAPYPPGAYEAYPPTANAPYPPDANAPYPSGGAALPYATSLAEQAYPPPPNAATAYPPATYPLSEGP